jgi:tripartite-type tricarboxylate transporter receptor subunit TctC
MDRRTFLAAALTSGLLITNLAADVAQAQNYPTGPITLVNPYAAGGPADLIARTVGAAMGDQLGQQIVILNKAGGATAIAASSVAQAQPDGYTLLLSNASSHIVTPALTKVTYDGMRDFTFIAMIASVPNVLVVRESLPLKSVPELIAYAKANPGKLNYASVGPGSQPHIAGEMFKQMTSTDITHVPYKGAAPAAVDLVAGQMDMGFLNIPPMLPHIQSGKLHGLAVTSLKRAGQLPNVASLDELGLKGFEVVTWYGIAAPAKLPQAIVDKLAAVIEKALASDEVKGKLNGQGVEVAWLGPKEFADYLQVDSDRLTKLIRTANIKTE